jgi:hypothetical protein
MPDSHACTYDFIKEGKKELQTQNPVISSNKMDYI